MKILKISIVVITILWIFTGPLNAAPPPATQYNPKPADDDLIIPMPNNAQMVFRKIVVPGQNFWGASERIVQVGDGEGDIFEGLQRVQVSGSFPHKSEGNWVYYLGKYEVTKAQFVSIMGLEKLIEASGDSTENSKIRGLKGKRLENALAKPLVFVSWHSIQEFIRKYNLWLFNNNHPERLKNLPKIKNAPGFLRPPMEIEWEYAARGGYAALKDGTYKNKLPFPSENLPKYAWFLRNAKHKVRPIGLRQPNQLGLYDVFGNAQELTNDLFKI